MSWFLRGVQSAVFYYISCAPCTKHTARKKREKQIERERQEREDVRRNDPNTYRQPSPYRTNKYWSEEIDLGPGPPPRNVTRKEREDRRQKRGREKPRTYRWSVADVRQMGELTENSTVDALKEKVRHAVPDRWRRPQREDEDLWGSNSPSAETLSPVDSRREPTRKGSFGESSVGSPGTNEISLGKRIKTSAEDFWTVRPPPINDLHPPIVSNPSCSAIGNRWMLQPPPSPSVMGGYTSANNRSRSGSGGTAGSSKKGTASVESLARQLSHRMIEDKLRKGQSLELTRSPDGVIPHTETHMRGAVRRLIESTERDMQAAVAEVTLPSAGAPQINHPLYLTSVTDVPRSANSSREPPSSPSSSSKGGLSTTPDSGVEIGAEQRQDWQSLDADRLGLSEPVHRDFANPVELIHGNYRESRTAPLRKQKPTHPAYGQIRQFQGQSLVHSSHPPRSNIWQPGEDSPAADQSPSLHQKRDRLHDKLNGGEPRTFVKPQGRSRNDPRTNKENKDDEDSELFAPNEHLRITSTPRKRSQTAAGRYSSSSRDPKNTIARDISHSGADADEEEDDGYTRDQEDGYNDADDDDNPDSDEAANDSDDDDRTRPRNQYPTRAGFGRRSAKWLQNESGRRRSVDF